ncbi:hypothetical protein JCM19239_5298 [Vibrio variabilis]|uniref:Uncharacterized protein n=1 Tax=Vibrio variabilis TaxID=990271 RepID=A0ABQ0JNR9_9VIBR|nr:hypothetical protein JCM19239_5298 [Vibrio variabilis]
MEDIEARLVEVVNMLSIPDLTLTNRRELEEEAMYLEMQLYS